MNNSLLRRLFDGSDLRTITGGINIIKEEIYGVLFSTVLPYLIMQMGAAHKPGSSALRDELPAFHCLTWPNEKPGKMSVQR
jgi:hypothetical protein